MRLTAILALFALALCTTGCGAAAGIVSGPLMGGTSLATRMYDSDAPRTAKVIGTPFVFASGTLTGVFPAVAEGFAMDGRGSWDREGFLGILDPFDAGLFKKK